MNEYKIDFIVAYNNERFFEECKFYVEHLDVPKGMEVSILGVWGASSMAAAYNEGMNASNAKYKVYMHQDLFIINKMFIYDVMKVFLLDDKIGMMGVLGGRDLPDNGIIYNAWNVGMTKADKACCVLKLNLNLAKEYMEVDAIDGMIMITQYDIPWRDDIFHGWDFYDISQSYEFRKLGYKVVVPWQNESWCLHDCGASKLGNYDENRRIFCREYIEKGEEKFFSGAEVGNLETQEIINKLRNSLVWLINKCEFAQVSRALLETDMAKVNDSELRIMKNIFEIYDLEMKDTNRDYILFTEGKSWKEMYDSYVEIKFLARRMGQGYIQNERVNKLVELVREKKISKKAVLVVCIHTVFEWKEVFAFLDKQT